MKKTIFGAALMICGALAACTEYLKHAIFFATPTISVIGENYLLSKGGIILFIAGTILCAFSIFKNSDNIDN